jgi:ABC-type multidrug transport system ATPase subunit
MGNLTVRETLRYAAILRLPSNVPMNIKMQKVDEVMDDLGLTKAADSIVGIPGFVKGISGGERKRLAIATELLTEPSVLFLDEVSQIFSFLIQI